MKKLILALVLFSCLSMSAQTVFTEFYCNSTGTNINAGSTTNATPTLSATGGNWTNVTQTFQFSGATDLSAITNGMWASVYPDAATTAVYIGRISVVNDANDFLTVSNITATGIAPTDGTGNRSIRIGGAWYGPWYSGATVDNLPFNFVNALLTNTSLASPRINLKNDRIYATTNVTHTSNGPMRFRGFATNAGDLGRTMLTGSTVGAGHAAFTFSGANCDFADFTFATNGTTSSSTLVASTSSEATFLRCVFRNARGYGLNMTGAGALTECEAFLCNVNNSSGLAGFALAASGITATRCIAHDNAGTGSSGFFISANVMLLNCISESNGRNGATVSSTVMSSVIGCDFYNNGTNGIDLTSASAFLLVIESCNFIGNGVGLTGAYAINSSGSLVRNGTVLNCAFGTGTATNGSGGANIIANTGMEEIGSIGYATDVTPWVDPANGDFRINLAAAINSGRGSFLQTDSGYAGTIGYPDIGAAQATNAVGGAGVTNTYTFPLFRR